MDWQPQLKYAYHGNMMRRGTIYHILLDDMKKLGKKETFAHGFSYKEDSLRSIFAKRFTIIKVNLNVTMDQLPQNLPDLSKIHLGKFPYIHMVFAPQ